MEAEVSVDDSKGTLDMDELKALDERVAQNRRDQEALRNEHRAEQSRLDPRAEPQRSGSVTSRRT